MFHCFLKFLIHHAHQDVLQGPNKFKNYRLRWLFRPLRLAKFESKCILQWLFKDPRQCFPSFSLFEFSQSFSQWSFPSNSLFLNALHCWLLLLLQCHPSVYGVPLIPSICYPGYQNQCCVSNIGGWSLPCSSLFPFFEIPSSKAFS